MTTEIEYALGFLFALLSEPLTYLAGIVWCFGAAFVLVRVVERGLNKSEGKEV